jgi:hypothetical protein
MLVSKIKPCMYKFTPLYGETANGSLNQLWFLRSYILYLDNCSNSRANTCQNALTSERVDLLEQNQPALAVGLMTLDNFSDRMASS